MLPLVSSLYNNAIHSATGQTPTSLHLGKKPMTPLDYLFQGDRHPPSPGTLDYALEYQKKLEDAVACMQKAQDAMMASENKHRQASTFQVGDRVWVRST